MSSSPRGLAAPTLLAAALLVPACGGRAALDEPLAPIPVGVDQELVEPPMLRVEWTVGATVITGLTEQEEGDRVPTRGPALDQGFAYLPYGNAVRALRLEDGSVAWTAYLPGPALLPPVTLAPAIAVATDSAWLWIDADGRARGVSPVEAPPRDAVAAGDLLVYVDGAAVHALRSPTDEAGPRVVWNTPLPGAAFLRSGPGGRSVVVTAGDQGVAAVDLVGGAVRWSHQNLEVIAARPAVGPRRTFVVGTDTRIRALSLADGDVDWTSKPIGVRVSSAPAMVDDVVWVAALDAALHGYTADGGSQLFRISLSGRAYIDLVSWNRWIVASPRPGPWSLVRGPLAAVGPANPGSPRKVDVSTGGDIELPPGAGPPGLVVVDTDGTVRLLRPPPWARGRPPGASTTTATGESRR